MAGLPVTIRLLDPPLHEFLPAARGGDGRADARADRARCSEANPMLGTRGCRLGLLWPEIYEMQVRAIVRAARAVEERTGEAPLVEIMHPLVGFAEELRRLRELIDGRDRAGGERRRVEYLVGTMIELPRACICAPTRSPSTPTSSPSARTTSRRRRSASRATTPRASSSTRYLEDGVLERNPFETLDQDGVGELMRIAVERGRGAQGRAQARHLRRARRRARLGRVLPPARARLRLLLALPRAARAARRGAGGAERVGHRGRRSGRLAV